MASFDATVSVRLREGVLDPQGQAIEGALISLGFEGVASVRQGRVFDVTLDAEDESAARDRLTAMCEALLANTVIERYQIALQETKER